MGFSVLNPKALALITLTTVAVFMMVSISETPVFQGQAGPGPGDGGADAGDDAGGDGGVVGGGGGGTLCWKCIPDGNGCEQQPPFSGEMCNFFDGEWDTEALCDEHGGCSADVGGGGGGDPECPDIRISSSSADDFCLEPGATGNFLLYFENEGSAPNDDEDRGTVSITLNDASWGFTCPDPPVVAAGSSEIITCTVTAPTVCPDGDKQAHITFVIEDTACAMESNAVIADLQCGCPPICGDGTVDPGEECDGGTGCDSYTCTCPEGEVSDGGTGCMPPCGNNADGTDGHDPWDPNAPFNEECDGGSNCDASCECIEGMVSDGAGGCRCDGGDFEVKALCLSCPGSPDDENIEAQCNDMCDASFPAANDDFYREQCVVECICRCEADNDPVSGLACYQSCTRDLDASACVNSDVNVCAPDYADSCVNTNTTSAEADCCRADCIGEHCSTPPSPGPGPGPGTGPLCVPPPICPEGFTTYCPDGVLVESITTYAIDPITCTCVEVVVEVNPECPESSEASTSTSSAQTGICCEENFCNLLGTCSNPYDTLDDCLDACGLPSGICCENDLCVIGTCEDPSSTLDECNEFCGVSSSLCGNGVIDTREVLLCTASDTSAGSTASEDSDSSASSDDSTASAASSDSSEESEEAQAVDGGGSACTDDDGGINKEVFSIVASGDVRGTDRCHQDGLLEEFYCHDDGGVTSSMVTCNPTDCYEGEGRCLREDEYECVDSDGGDDPYVYGETSLQFVQSSGTSYLEQYSDYCSSFGNLVEYFCRDSGTLAGTIDAIVHACDCVDELVDGATTNARCL